MLSLRESARETADFIRKTFNEPVAVGLITGTGLSNLPDGITPVCQFEYSQLPHFPISTVTGHMGCLLIGQINERYIMAMQGRFHLYEGYSPQLVSFPVRVMQQMGVRTLILNNAAGGLDPRFCPGDIVVIRDHINLTGENPLIGINDESLGLRFPDMTCAYTPRLRDLARVCARKLGIHIKTGIYAGVLGPSLETPAEVRYLKNAGADAVGMSTVMEVICAVHAGMDVLGLSLITNVNSPDAPASTTLEDVLDTCKKSIPDLNRLIGSILCELPD